MAATTQVRLLVWTFSCTLSFGVAVVGADFHTACTHPACTPSRRTGICTNSCKCGKTAIESWPVIWVHSSVVRAADCRSAGPWLKSGCALFPFMVIHELHIPNLRPLLRRRAPHTGTAAGHSSLGAGSASKLSVNVWFLELLTGRDQHAWVHSSVVRAADCRSAGPWLKSGCALVCA